MTLYNVGDKVWHAECEVQPVQMVCPVCNGNKAVVVILGTGEHVEVDCDFCGNGYDKPRGFRTVHRLVKGARQSTIRKYRAESDSDGHEERTYHIGDSRILYAEDICPDEASALARSEERAQAFNEREMRRLTPGKKDIGDKLTWTIGYWRGQAKRARCDAEKYDGFVRTLEGRRSS